MSKFFYLKKKGFSLSEIFERLQTKRKITLISVERIRDLSTQEFQEFKGIVVFGGDGTFLRAVPYAYQTDLPIIGINLGNFGFLTEHFIEEFYEVVEQIETQRAKMGYRSLLQIVYKNKDYIALNEGAIMKGLSGKIIGLDMYIEEEFLTTVLGDGMIISTPTGSTAYNLSAGGPIVHPASQVFVCTPICAFNINLRPFVIPDSYSIKIRLNKKREREKVHLLIDGQVNIPLIGEEPIIFRRAPRKLKIIESPKRSYVQILKTKFSW